MSDWPTCRICNELFVTGNLIPETSEPCVTCGETKIVYAHPECLGKEAAEIILEEAKETP
jgi:hypothetical protein